MPQYKQGDMWSVFDKADLFVITTNAQFSAAAELVMGAGIAGQAARRFPGLPYALAAQIRLRVRTPGQTKLLPVDERRYGLLISPDWPSKKLAALQTKYHWQSPADIALIRYSVGMLGEWASVHSDAQVHMPFPGIGMGRLPRQAVQPVLDDLLPDNVTVWEYPV